MSPEVLGASGLRKMSCVAADIFDNIQIGCPTQAQSRGQSTCERARRNLLRSFVFEAAQGTHVFPETNLTIPAANHPARLQHSVQIAFVHIVARRAYA
jgi:hypothetical protein